MACKRCIDALDAAGKVLLEMRALDRPDLPADTDWPDVAAKLLSLAEHLRVLNEQAKARREAQL